MSVDLSTTYLGLKLRNPVVVSACPLTEQIDALKCLEEHGAAAVVFPSLFEEQIEQEEMEIHRLSQFGTDSFAEALTYLPDLEDYNVGPVGYLRRLEEAKKAVEIPVIASLNGVTTGGWVRYARLMEYAGADALELNVFFIPGDFDMTAEDVERRYLELVSQVRAVVSIPLAVKIAPFFSSLGNMATRLVEVGADGLVIFNRFVHPDLDLENLKLLPNLVLSRPYDLRLVQTWIGLLRGKVSASLAATGGLRSADDALKLLLVGADVTMTTAALYENGPEYVRVIVDGIEQWLNDHDYNSVEQMKGSLSQEHAPDPAAFERVNYMKALAFFTSQVT